MNEQIKIEDVREDTFQDSNRLTHMPTGLFVERTGLVGMVNRSKMLDDLTELVEKLKHIYNER